VPALHLSLVQLNLAAIKVATSVIALKWVLVITLYLLHMVI